ncbi:Hypothetical protein SCF082_LOCUS49865 [Durusdinium trenchii]|uniref:Phytanoyl-CoA dioxygenase n=1 Tax=Durusdinium trenchii TaxID=1381693 RepID=A0ABP0S435_9DINO
MFRTCLTCALATAACQKVLSVESLLDFERHGHTVTRGLISPEDFQSQVPVLQRYVREKESAAAAHSAFIMSAQGMAGMEPPFLQTFNPHRHSPVAWQWTLALLSAACALLGTERLRLYQTSLFWKRRGHDATAWHQDLMTAPIATNDFITAWVPLHRVGSIEESPLVFQSCTHKDLAAKVHCGEMGIDPLSCPGPEDFGEHHVPLEEGDVTWHHGWVQHGAPALTKGVSRMAFTASYFADGALVMAPAETEDAPSFTSWLRDLRPGDQAEHPELPLLAPA